MLYSCVATLGVKGLKVEGCRLKLDSVHSLAAWFEVAVTIGVLLCGGV